MSDSGAPPGPSAAPGVWCVACGVAFADVALHRAHHRADWHACNLRRRAAHLPPLAREAFAARRREQEEAEGSGAASRGGSCAACGKRFGSRSTLESHLRSARHAARHSHAGRGHGQRPPDAPPTPTTPPRARWLEQRRHQQQEEEEEEEEGWEDIDSDEGVESTEELMEGEAEAAGQVSFRAEAIPVTDCLFCTHHSSSLMKNVAHMSKSHSFFIPDLEYLVDLRGLIMYLGEKVGVGKVCLWCNEKGKSFYTTKSVQAHMHDKSHCKLFTEGDAALEFADFYDFRSSYPDYQEGEEVEMSQELLPKKHVEYDDDTMELILPSGARIGHRSLMRYYKQRFGSSRALAVGKNKQRVGRLLQQYKALGWTSSTGAGLAQERDMQYLQQMKAKWMLKTSLKNNTTRQMHFRAQVKF